MSDDEARSSEPDGAVAGPLPADPGGDSENGRIDVRAVPPADVTSIRTRDGATVPESARDESDVDVEEPGGVSGEPGPQESGDVTDGESRAERLDGEQRKQLEREGEVAADFLETLLDICDLDGDLDVDIDGDRAAVAVVDSDEGRVPRRLVGQSGEVLEALQELTRLAVQSVVGERSRLMLDVAGHRAERRALLVEVAKDAISRVHSTGDRASLDPMSAFERKIVHDEVLAAGLVSASEGAEPRRFVVIMPS
jgi:spoIIIJ-associated protein